MKEIYVQLLDEGTTTYRPTQGVDHGDDAFYLLPTSGYDPEIETWEFPPGSLVLCDQVEREGKILLFASKLFQRVHKDEA